MSVPTMTIGEDPKSEELKNLRTENEDLRAQCRAYEEQLQRYRESEERAYMRGRIEGLEFAIRCNGVSGNEVKKNDYS